LVSEHGSNVDNVPALIPELHVCALIKYKGATLQL